MTKKKCAVILTIVSIVLFIAYSQLNAETVEKDINTEDFLSQVEDISAWMKKINTEKEMTDQERIEHIDSMLIELEDIDYDPEFKKKAKEDFQRIKQNLQDKINTEGDGWTITREKSEMDDTSTIILSKGAIDTLALRNTFSTPLLVARCKENKTDLFFVTGYNFNPVAGLYEKQPIRIRIDNEEAEEQIWNESTSDEAIFSENPVKILKRLHTSKSLKIEFTPFDSGSHVSSFDLSGINKYLPEIATTCNWEL